ncbi:MAG: SAM-dependent methyltransferase [Candidatus Zixiibacteriota bacterium]
MIGFDRIWLVFWFHRSREPKLTVVPFRDTVPRGLFATRAPSRPNPIGISADKLISVSECTLTVEDVDLIDGTPLLDIKPYVPEFDSCDCRRIGWLGVSTHLSNEADDRSERD